MKVEIVSPPGALLGEGPIWDAGRGLVWWTDIKGRTLHAHHAGSGRNVAHPLPCRVAALALTREGGLIGAGDAGITALEVSDGGMVTIGRLLAAPDEAAGNRFNDGKVDAHGRFWVGTMDDAEVEARGTLYRLDPGGQLAAVRSGMMVPNGPAFLGDGTMLIADSARRIVYAVTLDAAGAPLAERVWARFTGDEGYPDGMTVDAHNHVWVAFWDGWCVRRFDPDGRVTARVPLPVQRPTCPCFGESGLGTLYVTSAAVGLSAADLAAQPAAGALLRIEVGVTGVEPHLLMG